MKKAILILSLLLLFMSTAAFAAVDPILTVSQATVEAGESFDVKITISNNPGIAFMRLSVQYDKSALTLVGVKDGGILGNAVHSPDLAPHPYVLFWNNGTAVSDFKGNGTIVTLTFKVDASAAAKEYPITLSYDNDNDDIMNVNFGHIEFTVQDGKAVVSAPQYLYGDITADGSVNISDAIYMAQYLASDAIELTAEQKVAADVYYDGVINISDMIKLQQYLASPSVIVLGPEKQQTP